MVFNSVFFETNESGELAYFARPQKISNVSYLFADIMNVYSQKNNVLSSKPAAENEKGDGALSGFPVLTGNIDSSSIDKIIDVIKKLSGAGKTGIKTGETGALQISEGELQNLLMQIGGILGKSGQQQISVKGAIAELQRKIASGSDFSLLLNNGETDITVKVSQPDISGSAGKSGMKFLLTVTESAGKDSGFGKHGKIKDSAGEKNPEGFYAISVVVPSSSKTSDAAGKSLEMLSGEKQTSKLMKDVSKGTKGNILSKAEFTNLLKSTSDFIKDVKKRIASGEAFSSGTISNIKEKADKLLSEIGKAPADGFRKALVNELKSFSESLSSLKNEVSASPGISKEVNAVLRNLEKISGGNLSSDNFAKIGEEIESGIKNLAEEVSQFPEMKKLSSRLENLVKEINSDLKTKGNISGGLDSKAEEILSGIKAADTNSAFTKEKSADVKTELVNELKSISESLSSVKKGETLPAETTEKLTKALKSLEKVSVAKSEVKSDYMKSVANLKNEVKKIIAESSETIDFVKLTKKINRVVAQIKELPDSPVKERLIKEMTSVSESLSLVAKEAASENEIAGTTLISSDKFGEDVLSKKANQVMSQITELSDSPVKEKFVNEITSISKGLSSVKKGETLPAEITEKLTNALKSLDELPASKPEVKSDFVKIVANLKNEVKGIIEGSSKNIDAVKLTEKVNRLAAQIKVLPEGSVKEKFVNEITSVSKGLTSLKNGETLPTEITEKLTKMLAGLDELPIAESSGKSDIEKLSLDLKKELSPVLGKAISSRKISKINKTIDALVSKLKSTDGITGKKALGEKSKIISGAKDEARTVNNNKTAQNEIKTEKIKETIESFEKNVVKLFSEESAKISNARNSGEKALTHTGGARTANGLSGKEPDVAKVSSGKEDANSSANENSGKEREGWNSSGSGKSGIQAKSNFRTAFIEKVDALPTNTPNVMRESFAQNKPFAGFTASTLTKEELIRNFTAIIEKAKEKSITLQLQPETLGKVKVTLSVTHNQAVQANIQVENHLVKQFVENNLSQLYAQMGKGGAQFSSVNVSVSQNPFTKDSNSHGSNHKRGKGKYNNVEEYATENEAGKARAFGYNTYEYLA